MGLILAAVAVLIGGFLVANNSGGDGNGSSSSTVTVKHGKPEGGIQKIEVKKGDRVRFTVVSDVADEIHVHGYNFMRDVKAGGKVSFSFVATIDGKFEIELEGRKQQIAALTVAP
jgi:FtsP/CotA-like multicopper oxidase with cupredoxin domain